MTLEEARGGGGGGGGAEVTQFMVELSLKDFTDGSLLTYFTDGPWGDSFGVWKYPNIVY